MHGNKLLLWSKNQATGKSTPRRKREERTERLAVRDNDRQRPRNETIQERSSRPQC